MFVCVGISTLPEVLDVLRVALQELLRPPVRHSHTNDHITTYRMSDEVTILYSSMNG